MKNRRIPVLVKVPTLLVLIVAMSCATAQVLPTTAYSYDHAGRLQSVTAPLGQSTTFEYDVAGNLVQETHPAASSSEPSGIVAMGYTGSGTVSQVTDPRGLTTAYAINGFGNVTAQDSPDTGRTERGYDDAGNLVQSTDARGVTSRMAYDGLNRLVSIDYGDEQVSLTYGTSGTSAGKVVLMVDGSGQTAWTYDNAGNIASKTQTVAGRVLTVSYAWSGSRVTRITYPSGRVVGYTYDGANVAGISVDGVAIVTSIQYQPFGPVKSWSMGAAGVYSREFDKYGRVTGHSAPGGLTTIAWDANSNPASIQAAGGPARAYGYDGMDRLSSASEGGLGTSGFAYDLTGNRVQAEQGMSTFPYSVESDSNRLNNSSSAVEARTYQYDAAGNTLSDGIRSMTYNNAGRLVSVSHPNGGGTYRYNGAGQRVAKQAGAGSGVFLYAESEYDVLGTYGADGVASEEVIYLEGVPVALMRDGVIFYVLPDHLGTPRAIAKQDGALVWQWLSTAFGNTAPNTDPSGLGDFRFNGRFPGQRADLESGLVYNNARYYDPSSGRYTQSDPIGLAGGLNTYGYASQNPVSKYDATGLQAQINLFKPKSPEYLEMLKVPKSSTTFYVAGHGSPVKMKDNSRGGNDDVSPETMAEMIKAHPEFFGKSQVVLFSCDTGLGYAQKVANLIGKPVYAPKSWIYIYSFDDTEFTIPVASNISKEFYVRYGYTAVNWVSYAHRVLTSKGYGYFLPK